MKRIAELLAAAALTASAPAMAQEAAGDWTGTLVAGANTIPVAVHVRRDDAGAHSGTLDSPTQGAMGIPLAEVAVAEGRLTFSVPAIAGNYAGTWDAVAKTWVGEWRQGSAGLPLTLAIAPPPPPLPADWVPPSNDDINALISERLGPRTGQGLVVGVLESSGRRVIAGGGHGADLLKGDALFEIGSISKVFTALILADMVAKGEVSLDDPAEKYLPAGATMPSRNDRKITLADLSTHASGLPRLPDNMPFSDAADPYADYTEALLLEFLSSYQLQRDIGERAEYSNLGVGLLGYLLGRAAGSDYETLLRERITGPLGMTDTAITLTAEQQARFATPLDAYLQPTKPWSLGVLLGAGGIRSTANDMLKFAAALLDPNSPLAPAMRIALAERRSSGNARSEQGLGWGILHPTPEREILMHDGGTGGFRSVLVLEPAKGTAVVVLANSAAEPGAADIGLRVLTGSQVAPTRPVPPPPPARVARTEVTLPVAELDRVVGRYEFAPGVVFAITREGNQLRAQRQGAATGPVLPIFAEAPLKFFWRAVNGSFEFTTDARGMVTGAVATLEGQSLPGKKLAP